MKAAISVSAMCRLLHMSRSQFYAHVQLGNFHHPLYMVRNKRPFFTAAMATENLQAKESCIGVSGGYVLFYQRRQPVKNGTPTTTTAKRKTDGTLISTLRSLGLFYVTDAQVDEAVAACFPNGTDVVDESEVLRAVFRQLKGAKSG